jgi:hypothetical protein
MREDSFQKGNSRSHKQRTKRKTDDKTYPFSKGLEPGKAAPEKRHLEYTRINGFPGNYREARRTVALRSIAWVGAGRWVDRYTGRKPSDQEGFSSSVIEEGRKSQKSDYWRRLLTSWVDTKAEKWAPRQGESTA